MLSRPDFEAAIAARTLSFDRPPAVQDISIDMALAIVDTQRHGEKPIESDGYWHFQPGEFCLGVLEPQVTYAAGLWMGMVTTRSSYARLGLSVRSCSDGLEGFDGFMGKIEVTIKANTHVRVRPGEELAQFTVYPPDEVPCLETTPLTLKPEILMYDGSTLLSSGTPEITERAFKQLVIPAEGLEFSERDIGAFFLASSKEVLDIPNDRVGYLPERIDRGWRLGRIGYRYAVPVHNAAPLIRPGTQGAITLECHVTEACRLTPGMSIPPLEYRHLRTPLSSPGRTRYYGQAEPTLARL